MSLFRKVILLLLFAVPAFPATLVQQAAATGSGTTLNVTLNGITAGNFVGVSLNCRGSFTISGVAGTLNTTYTVAGSATRIDAAIYYFENSAGGNETLTITFNGATTANYVTITEWSGLLTSASLDDSDNNVNGSGTSHVTGSINTTGAGMILGVAQLSGNDTKTAGAGFTKLSYNPADASRVYMHYRINSGAEAATGPFTTTGAVTSSVAMANFLDAGGSQSVVPHMIQQSAANDHVFDQRLAANERVLK